MLVSSMKKYYKKLKDYLKLKYFNKSNIIPLAPRIVNQEYVFEYLKSIHAAVKNKDLYNIAITGNYGTGKSSIIKTYINKLKLKKKNYIIINISSYFKTEKEVINGDNNILEKDELELVDKIEAAIIRQILYINSSDEIVESSLKRVTGKRRRIINNLSLNLVFYGILFYFLFSFYEKNKELLLIIFPFIKNLERLEKFGLMFLIILVMFFIISILYLMTSLVPLIFSGLKTLRIKFGVNEINFLENDEITFNKNLGEIITFFSYNKDYKIIVFEDIDRFCKDITLKVIEDLKELNYKINNSNSVSQKVSFIYLFREDIFLSVEDKSKFYDHIVSIMPISTYYNSKDNLLELLKERKCDVFPDKKLISIVSDYIFDQRTLITIVNSYELFSNILKSNDKDKIFAIAVFKNYYYKEYGNILLRDNEIEKRFKSLYNKKRYLIDLIEDENKDLINKKEIVLDENEKNKKELKQLLWLNAIKDKNVDYFFIKNKKYKYEDFIDDSFDIYLLKENVCYVNGIFELDYSHFGNKEMFFKDYEMSKNRKLDDINNKLLKNIRKIKLINEMDIAEIYNDLEFSENKDLLDELIYNKYIENDYLDYITAPSSSGMTGSDNKFIFDVKHKTLSYMTKISSFSIIIEQLEDYFDDYYILNFYLIIFLIDNLDKYNKLYIRIINQFKIISKEHLDFFYLLINNNREYFYKFINSIKNQKIDIWNNIIQVEASSFIKENVFIGILITNSYCNSMKKGSQKSFCEFANSFFNNSLNYNLNLLLKNSIIRKNITTYIGYNLRIKYLNDFSDFNKNFFIEKGLYEYNDLNIKEILKFIPYDLNNSNVTSHEEGKVFLFHIEKNFKYFFLEYYKNNDILINNSKLIKVILRQKLSQEIKKEIYRREKFQLNSNEIDNYLVVDTLKYNHFIIAWKDILKFNNLKKQDLLIEIIIKNKSELFLVNNIKNNKDVLRQNINLIKILFLELLKREYLEEAEILSKKVLSDQDVKISSIATLKDSAITLLLKYNMLKYSKIALNRISKIDKNLIISFLENWYDETKSANLIFKAIMGNNLYEELFFKCREIDVNEKIKIILNNYSKDVIWKMLSLVLITGKIYNISNPSKSIKKMFLDKYKMYFLVYEINEKIIKFSFKSSC